MAPPEDGVYELDFYAEPPTGPAGQMISNISAALDYGEFPPDLKGIRVYSETDSAEALL